MFNFEVHENNHKVYEWSTNSKQKAEEYKKIIITVLQQNIYEDKHRSFKLITTIHDRKKKTIRLIKELYNTANFRKPFILCDTTYKAYKGYSNKSKNHVEVIQKRTTKEKVKAKDDLLQLNFYFY